jgi:transketolase
MEALERKEKALSLLVEHAPNFQTYPEYPIDLDQTYLQSFSAQIRKDVILSTFAAGSGHPGGSLSSAEMMSTLFVKHLKHRPQNPKWEGRDFVLFSKGHVSPLLYSLFVETGYYDRSLLASFRSLGSPFQGHPASSRLDAVEVSSGSLGQGLSVGVGLALGLKSQNKLNRVYVLCGDGESQEGQIWEAIMAAAHYRLDNLTLFFDYNNLEIDGWVEDVMGIAPVKEKFQAFNWITFEVDGHNLCEIDQALTQAKTQKDRPSVIIGKTIKGKGISFMENQADWHGKAPNLDQTLTALSEINQALTAPQGERL